MSWERTIVVPVMTERPTIVAVTPVQHSYNALKYALVKEEIKPGDSVILCHVVPERTGMVARLNGIVDNDKKDEAQTMLDNLVAMCTEKKLRAEYTMLQGDVAEKIIGLVREKTPTKLIMGYSGRRPEKPKRGTMTRRVIDGVKQLCTILIATDTAEVYRHNIGGTSSPSGSSTPGSQGNSGEFFPGPSIGVPILPRLHTNGDDYPAQPVPLGTSLESRDSSISNGSIGDIFSVENILSKDVWPSSWQDGIKGKIRELDQEREEALSTAKRSDDLLASTTQVLQDRLRLVSDLRRTEARARQDLAAVQQDMVQLRAELDERLQAVDQARREAEDRARGAELELHMTKEYLEESSILVASLKQELLDSEGKKERLELELNDLGRKLNDCEQELAETVASREILKQQLTKEQMALANARLLTEGERARAETARSVALAREEELRKVQSEQERREQARRGYTEYTYEELKAATNNFDESLKLGEGGFGPVYRGTIRLTKVAIKKLHEHSQQGVEELRREIQVLQSNPHQHIVMLYGVCSSHNCLVYEFMEHGNLEDRIRSEFPWGPLYWEKRLAILYQVAQGLYFLHSAKPPVIHRDLKPANILLGANDVAKVGDVGLAKIAYELQTDGRSLRTFMQDSGRVGSWHYIDPEYKDTGNFGVKSDVFALGIIMLQMLTGKGPLESISAFEQGETNAVSMRQKLDKRAGLWGREIAERLRALAWNCRKSMRRDRPPLFAVVQELEELCRAANELVQQRAESFKGQIAYDIRDSLLCPISWEIMKDPHVAMDGHTYEKAEIEKWLTEHDTSPMTNERLESRRLIPNRQCKSQIQEILARETERAIRNPNLRDGTDVSRYFSANQREGS